MIEIEVTTPGHKKYIEYLSAICKTTIKQVDFAFYDDILFALRELLMNAVKSSTVDSEIMFFVNARKEEVVIKVINETKDTDFSIKDYLENHSFDQLLLSESGRGLLIVQELVDELWQEETNENKIMIGMRKKGEFHRT